MENFLDFNTLCFDERFEKNFKIERLKFIIIFHSNSLNNLILKRKLVAILLYHSHDVIIIMK